MPRWILVRCVWSVQKPDLEEVNYVLSYALYETICRILNDMNGAFVVPATVALVGGSWLVGIH